MQEETYETAKKRYLTCKAIGDWRGAAHYVSEMIALRPCDEALPQLAEWHEEAQRERKAQESTWRRLLERLMGGKVVA